MKALLAFATGWMLLWFVIGLLFFLYGCSPTYYCLPYETDDHQSVIVCKPVK